jgi:dihydropteroate synthase
MSFLKIGNKNYNLREKTLIMGILNVTPDSFSDGGKFISIDKAVNHAISMVDEGADIIDVGGESTRPGAKPVSVDEETSRVLPVIMKLKNKIDVPISIDTFKFKIAKKAIDAGASMVNDITALRGDESMSENIAKYDVPICLMHMKGTPQNMQINPNYVDVVKEIKDFLDERVKYAISCNIKKENIIIDPGLGFGKRTGKGIEDNCDILKRLSELKKLGFPILVGPSRKTFIGNVYGGDKQLPVNERLQGSIAAAVIAVMNGADIIRVHDVKETKNVISIYDSVIKK